MGGIRGLFFGMVGFGCAISAGCGALGGVSGLLGSIDPNLLTGLTDSAGSTGTTDDAAGSTGDDASSPAVDDGGASAVPAGGEPLDGDETAAESDANADSPPPDDVADDSEPPDLVAPSGDVVHGASLFRFNCQHCHGEGGSGGSAAAIRGASQAQIGAAIGGANRHPNFSAFSDSEIEDLAAYLAAS